MIIESNKCAPVLLHLLKEFKKGIKCEVFIAIKLGHSRKMFLVFISTHSSVCDDSWDEISICEENPDDRFCSSMCFIYHIITCRKCTTSLVFTWSCSR